MIESELTNIAQRLLLLRRIKRARAVDLCNAISMKKAKLSNLETGNSPLNMDDAIAFANYFGVTLDFIFLGRLDGLSSDKTKEILSLTSKINKSNFRKLMQYRTKRARKQAGFTQYSVALALNVNRDTYSKWENGDSIIPLRYVMVFTRLTNVSLDEFLEPSLLKYEKMDSVDEKHSS